MNKIDINKSVPSERWLEFFDQFADGNRGRHTAVRRHMEDTLNSLPLSEWGF